MNTDHEDMAIVQRAMDQLSEHFDTVQVFTTRHDPDGTASVQMGCGNWFARYGQVQTWMLKQNEGSRLERRADE